MLQSTPSRVALVLLYGVLIGVTATALRATPDAPQSKSAPGPADANRKLCTIITPDDVRQITAKTYSETNSQADLSTMKHCEYRGGMDVVSITLVTGDNARSRFEANQKFPGLESVPGLGDAAVWQPAMGKLSAHAKDRTVDVTVSASHGDGATRKKIASRILQLVQSRM